MGHRFVAEFLRTESEQVVTYPGDFIERAALHDVHAAATPEMVTNLKLEAASIGSALVSVAGALPASAIVLNRTIGAGVLFPESKTTIDAMVARYRSAGASRFFIHRHPDAQPAQMVDWLLAAGLQKVRGWQKFSRGRDGISKPKTDLRIERIGPQWGQAFGRIVCDAFDFGDAAIPWLAQLPGRDGWHVFMSFDGDQPAGTGTVFVREDIAWFDFGATAPAFRRRGSQGAILAERIGHALDLACRSLCTCTGEAVPGDPQHSYRNIERAGFHPDYLRENYAPVR